MALIQVNYLSKALFREVPVNVILPVDRFDADTNRYLNGKDRKYKTLYLLHGLLGNYTDWISQTRIQKWAEEKNLAVVMPSGDNAFYFNSRTPWNDYGTFIGEELVDVTRRMFPLSEKREDTFIAGLSMGGFGALRNGIVYSKNFSHVAGLSSAVHIFEDTSEEANIGLFDNIEDASKTNKNPWVAVEEMLSEKRPIPKIYMACGTKDDLMPANISFRNFLQEKGFEVTWDEDDYGHDWDFWDSQIKKVLDWLPLE
ncbi:S-formylglutathione hydrolase FrmB [Pseudobutyrivibrio sp. 49]|uniref:alpha/beta hydrolase n=1 Tax=unclassified Pseudobutyrivibrio TaxID=2638619 RepID=UPI0008846D16|nr:MULTISPECIES: alpha/beta hydrolase family protein [unclassified Pseudobutyrivibrio]SDI75709.1 S-formylglutathione hydrolase FrmB [Pseudobutyrivibrio sp. 49]SFN97501.1 S-formylglutathione hydrolase FrmB [Pseudobutyrivibrio sp. UC1225]